MIRKKDEEPGPSIGRQLLKARSILLFGAIDAKVAKVAITQLIAFDHLSPEEPIRVHVNSPGAYPEDAFAVYDVMRYVKAPVYTVCTGVAAGAAALVLLGASDGHRYAMPNARIMLHQPSRGGQGSATDVSIVAQEVIRLRQRVNELLAAATGKPVEKVQTDLQREFWMSADEAREYGLIDTIVASAADLPGE